MNKIPRLSILKLPEQRFVGFRLELENGKFDSEDIEEIITAVNEVFIELSEKPLDLHKDFNDWEERINRLDKNSRRLAEIDEIYLAESDRILAEAREIKIDFKALYGANNKDTRKQYVDEQEHIAELLEEKKELEFVKADDNRRISFLKKLIDMKINLIKYEDGK